LSLVTRPDNMRRRPRSFGMLPRTSPYFPLQFALAQERADPCDVATDELHPCVIGQLAGCILESKIEQLLLKITQSTSRLGIVQRPQLGHLHAVVTAVSRSINRVAMGSLCAARWSASRASSGATPPTSNMTRPGRTTATQWSGAPFPPPMRVSAGLAVAARSGKIRIQTLPPRFRWWVIVRRAASICRAVIHAGSSACKPISPKEITLPEVAIPFMRPRWVLRYLTRFG